MVSPVPKPSSRTRFGRERDRLDRRLLQLVVARDVGADQVQVGLRGRSGTGHGARRRCSFASLTSVRDRQWRRIQPSSSSGLRPAPGTASDSSSSSSLARCASAMTPTCSIRLRSRRASRSPHAAAGYAMRLAFMGELTGPCMRCLAPARVGGRGRGPGGRPARDRRRGAAQPVRQRGDPRPDRLGPRRARPGAAPADPLPAGLRGPCAVCGESLNDAEPGAHDHPREPDPRWAKLRELQ